MNLFFLVSNMHTGMAFINSSFSGWGVGIDWNLDVVPNVAGFFSLKTSSPKTSEAV